MPAAHSTGETCTSTPSSKSALKKHLRAKLQAQPPEGQRSAFRDIEKQYLTRNPPPDYSKVIDLSAAESSRPGINISRLDGSSARNQQRFLDDGAMQLNCTKVFTFDAHPGLLLIPHALNPSTQRSFIKTCMRDITRRPNLNNLDTHYTLPKEGLWSNFELHARQPSLHPDLIIEPLATSAPGERVAVSQYQSSRKLVTEPAITRDSPIEVLKAAKEPAPPSETAKPIAASALLYKLRWTNLGLMYHWHSKSYHYEDVFKHGPKAMIPVPSCLSDLCVCLLSQIPTSLVPVGEKWTSFRPESGIVNFYQKRNSLMGHIDQSELVEDKPLVSFSFGHSAVFLIGGITRDIAPTAIYLHSGDALIMSGGCRRAYHGVPRIVEDSLPAYLKASTEWNAADRSMVSEEESKDWEPFAHYLSTTRINVNVRQVFPDGYLDDLSQGHKQI